MGAFLNLPANQHSQSDPTEWTWTILALLITLKSGINVGQGINVGPGKFGKENKCRALNRNRAWRICQKE